MATEEKKVKSNIKIEGAQIMFKNFAGKKTQYNEEGNRNFGVRLDPESAKILEKDGWNVRYLKPRADDPDQVERPWLKVKVKYNEEYPPIVQLITSGGRIRLTAETIDQLDWTAIDNIDLVIRPYNYDATPTCPAGVAAYLKAMYVTVREDDLESKYANIPYIERL